MELPSALCKAKLEYGKTFLLASDLLQVLDKYCAFYEIPEARDILSCMIDNWYHVNMVNLGYKVSDCESFITRMHFVNGYDVDIIRYVYESLAYALGQRKTIPLVANRENVMVDDNDRIDIVSFMKIAEAAIDVWNVFVTAVTDPLAGVSIMYRLYFDNLKNHEPDETEYMINLKMMLLSDVRNSIIVSAPTTGLHIDIASRVGLAYFIVAMRVLEENTNVNYENYELYLEKYKERIQSLCDGTDQYCREEIKYKPKGLFYFVELLNAQIIPPHLLSDYQLKLNKLKINISKYGTR